MSIQILLGKKVAWNCLYSVEAGRADGRYHWDHHNLSDRNNPSPGNDERIQAVSENDIVTIGITHLDADTFVGLLRLLGKKLPNIDFHLLEKIDLNGSSVVEDKQDHTLSYMKGISTLSYMIKFPRMPLGANETVDVTEFIMKLINEYTAEEIIEIGRLLLEKEELTYQHNRMLASPNGKIGMWEHNIFKNEEFDPSRPYDDGYEVVVVFRPGGGVQCSIYVAPTSTFAIKNAPTEEGEDIAEFNFHGHPKACGGERGLEFTLEMATKVFNEVAKRFEA